MAVTGRSPKTKWTPEQWGELATAVAKIMHIKHPGTFNEKLIRKYTCKVAPTLATLPFRPRTSVGRFPQFFPQWIKRELQFLAAFESQQAEAEFKSQQSQQVVISPPPPSPSQPPQQQSPLILLPAQPVSAPVELPPTTTLEGLQSDVHLIMYAFTYLETSLKDISTQLSHSFTSTDTRLANLELTLGKIRTIIRRRKKPSPPQLPPMEEFTPPTTINHILVIGIRQRSQIEEIKRDFLGMPFTLEFQESCDRRTCDWVVVTRWAGKTGFRKVKQNFGKEKVTYVPGGLEFIKQVIHDLSANSV